MRSVFLILLCFCTLAFGKAPGNPVEKGWVPEGWKLVVRASGDLNKDGQSDEVLVLEENNPARLKPNTGLGEKTLNLNPRRLLILFKAADGYVKTLGTDRFIPSANDENAPCLADPLKEKGNVQITRGVLRLDLHYWSSCGSYGFTHNKFLFRYQDRRFRLIGLDTTEVTGSGGDRTEYSTNYLTGKQKVTRGLSIFEPDPENPPLKPETTWKTLATNRKYYLDEMSSACDREDKESWCQ